MNAEKLKQILLKKGEFTIPDIQHEFDLKYTEVHKCVLQLIKEERLILSDKLTYSVQSVKQTGGQAANEKNRYGDMLRRRELLERLARFSDDDDEEDDETDDVDWFVKDAQSDLKTSACEKKSCKMVGGFNYGVFAERAQQITEKMALLGIALEIRSIQFGIDNTRFVFECLSKDCELSALTAYESDIRASISADKVSLIAPFGQNQIAVVVGRDTALDLFCKKALIFWLERNGGKASIASLQRNLGIGFNRGGRILEQLQNLGCVENNDPVAIGARPLCVTIGQEDVETLFPSALGW